MRRGDYRIIFCLIFICLLTGVYAASVNGPTIAEGVEKMLNFIATILEKINLSWILNLDVNDVIRLLYGCLLFIIIFYAIDMMNLFDLKKWWINVVLAFAVTVIVIIALPKEFFSYLIPSYESLASLLFAVIPFIAIFYVSAKVKKQIWGRMLWLFVIILGLVMFFRYGLPYYGGNFTDGIIYLGIALLGLIMVIFLPGFRKWVFNGEMNDLEKEMKGTSDIEREVTKSRLDEARELRRFSEIK